MTSLFSFHPTVNEAVPYSARYSFPNQLTRSYKRTVKLTPRNNATSFKTGTTIRFEFPSSGYLNPNTTYLAFNAGLQINTGSYTQGTTTEGGFEFQQNIQSIFRRVRVLYGSLVIEDIQDYNILQRIFTEITLPSGTDGSGSTMYQGIGISKRYFAGGNTAASPYPLPLNYDRSFTRFNYHSVSTETTPANVGTTFRRYAVPINVGLLQQQNLIPLKFMANQLQIELEIADPVDCTTWVLGTGGSPSVPTATTVLVGLPEIVAELLEFDSEFDSAVYDILGTGLPIYFQSWHMTSQNIPTNLIASLNIQETARSVRYALAVIVDDTNRTIVTDAHIFGCGLQMNETAASPSFADIPQNINQSLVTSFQWRLGGTYYPSQPVPVYDGTLPNTTAVDANYSDPPVEAYAELMKTFGNIFADDGTFFMDQNISNFASPRYGQSATTTVNGRSFIMAGNFMTDRGDVISGINAEEQNDMQLTVKFIGTTSGTAKTIKIATCFDNLIILGENNNMILVN